MLGSKHEEIRANPSTGLQFRWLPVCPVDRSGVTNSRKMGKFTSKAPLFQDSQFMSLIGLLTATEKQVWSGRLHLRPIHWRQKRHWHVLEILEKIIPLPTSLHPHLAGCWMKEMCSEVNR